MQKYFTKTQVMFNTFTPPPVLPSPLPIPAPPRPSQPLTALRSPRPATFTLARPPQTLEAARHLQHREGRPLQHASSGTHLRKRENSVRCAGYAGYTLFLVFVGLFLPLLTPP